MLVHLLFVPAHVQFALPRDPPPPSRPADSDLFLMNWSMNAR
jgi:hypothetical protein